jgi:16S rRNA G527 N7-methylase RsmG
VVTARIEDWQPAAGMEPAAVLVRAVAPLARLAEWTRPLLDAGAPLLAMKGPAWRQEAEQLPDDLHVTSVQDYALPGTEHRHVLVAVGRRSAADLRGRPA